jgi:hypothetical protein
MPITLNAAHKLDTGISDFFGFSGFIGTTGVTGSTGFTGSTGSTGVTGVGCGVGTGMVAG